MPKIQDYAKTQEFEDEFQDMEFYQMSEMIGKNSDEAPVVTIIGYKPVKKKDGTPAVFLILDKNRYTYSEGKAVINQITSVPQDAISSADPLRVKFVTMKSKTSGKPYTGVFDAE